MRVSPAGNATAAPSWAPAKPVVAMWKANWLPPSQTFVKNQVDALTRWSPLLLGLRRVPDGLPVEVARAPFAGNVVSRSAQRLSARTGHRWLYDGLLRRREVALVHAHFGPSAITALPLARRNGLPLIATFHGYDVTRLPFQDQTGARYRADLQRVFDYGTMLIAVSEFVAGRLMDLGAPADRIRVHYIGTPLAGLPPPPVPDSSAHGIIFVGRLIEQKGVADLIDAVALLPSELRNSTPVTIVGYGPLDAQFKVRAAAAGVRVNWTGRRSPDEVSSLLRRASVFCAPSKTVFAGDTEALGIVYLEAAAQGLPVVAYRHGGVPEAVLDGTTGLLAAEGDVRALARNLETLLRDRALNRAMGEAGRQRVRDSFDIRRQTALLEDIYDEVRTEGASA